MKRLRPALADLAVALPRTVPEKAIQFEFDGPPAYGCLRCPDTPCLAFSEDELTRSMSLDAPIAPDRNVCPTDAVVVDSDGQVSVDSARCIECGLCIARCPVGAISLSSSSAMVSPPLAGQDIVPYDERSFVQVRAKIAASFAPSAVPFVDDGVLGRQVDRLLPALAGNDGQRILRRLARNAFLVGTIAVRLKNPGDNNAVTELVADDGASVFLVELETGSDLLDALRRVLSGLAIAVSRYGVTKDLAVPVVVLPRLPNERVDYYRVVTDIEKRLDVKVRTVPVAALLLAVRCGYPLNALIKPGFVADESHPGVADALASVATLKGDPSALGLEPGK